MYGAPSAWVPSVLRRLEIACSMLLSATATSCHAAAIKSSFEMVRPALAASCNRISRWRSGTRIGVGAAEQTPAAGVELKGTEAIDVGSAAAHLCADYRR